MATIRKNKQSKNSVLHTNQSPSYDADTLHPSAQFRVQEIRELTDTAYIMRFDKNSVRFKAGQHITLGLPGDNQIREYSIYSSPNQPFLEVLIKEVEKGVVSKNLHRAKPGDLLKFDGPFGFFTLDETRIPDNTYLFIASGTGIAPFHSITGAYPELDYHILHGVRYVSESYEHFSFPEDRYTLCTSRDDRGDFQGRVTDYLMTHKIDSRTLVYLCGNCDMIYEAYDILTKAGIEADQIKTEVYF